MKNKKKLLLAGLCSVLVLTSGCAKIPKLQNGEEVVASIDGKQITAEELYKKMKKQSGTGIIITMIDDFIANKEVPDEKDAKDYADSQVQALKAQYQMAGQDFNMALLSNGYANEEELKADLISDYKKNKVAENQVKSEVTEDEINKYYEEEIFGEITAKHILIKPVTTNDMTTEQKENAEKEALEKAKKLIEELNNGADFDTLAKEHSDDTASAGEGGLIADFTKSDVVKEFWDASYKLENGKYTAEPVKSTFGYHIILKVSSKEKPTLDTVKDDVIDSIVKNKFSDDSKLVQKAWAEVRKRYNLNITDTDIKNIYDATVSGLK